MTDERPDGRVDSWTNAWTAGQAEGRVGQDGGHGQEGQVGQVKRVGSGQDDGSGREDRTGCPSMNVARGRRPTNARSTKIRRSGSWLFRMHNFPCLVSFGCMLGVSVEV